MYTTFKRHWHTTSRGAKVPGSLTVRIKATDLADFDDVTRFKLVPSKSFLVSLIDRRAVEKWHSPSEMGARFKLRASDDFEKLETLIRTTLRVLKDQLEGTRAQEREGARQRASAVSAPPLA